MATDQNEGLAFKNLACMFEGIKMKTMVGRVDSVCIGAPDSEFSKNSCDCLQVELDGLVGDRHRGIEREAWEGDKQVKGTIRRNERQWSAVSAEELALISQEMNLKEPLTAAILGANIGTTGTIWLASFFVSDGFPIGPTRQIALMHTGANLLMGVCLLPWVHHIARFIQRF